MGKLRGVVAVWLLLLVVGCAGLGLEPANTFTDKLAYAYGTHTAVLRTADAEAKAGYLNKEDGLQVLASADQARAILDSASLIKDPVQANAKLVLGLSILQQLQTYLRSHQK